jgi:hypothetical protein
MSVSARRIRKSVALVLLACASAVPMLLVACKQPAPAIVDSGPPPAATDAAPAVLVPMDEDAGLGIDAAVAVVHHPGGGLNANQARMKQCCAALAKTAGTDPTLNTLVVTCNAFAIQMGPSAGGQAPEFAALRNALKGHNVPAVCSGL